MSIVIIHGRKASSKTRNPQQLLKHYGCKRIVSAWRPGKRLQHGELALTIYSPAFGPAGAVWIDADQASRAIGVKAV